MVREASREQKRGCLCTFVGHSLDILEVLLLAPSVSVRCRVKITAMYLESMFAALNCNQLQSIGLDCSPQHCDDGARPIFSLALGCIGT